VQSHTQTNTFNSPYLLIQIWGFEDPSWEKEGEWTEASWEICLQGGA